jgi:hypothetical protein
MTGASLATPTGLEPAASAVTGRRANQLRYGAWRVVLDRLTGPSGILAQAFAPMPCPQRDSNPCYRLERATS